MRALRECDFKNTRKAKAGEVLELGRTSVPRNMGGECALVYGFWDSADHSQPVFVPYGSTLKFQGDLYGLFFSHFRRDMDEGTIWQMGLGSQEGKTVELNPWDWIGWLFEVVKVN